MSRQILRLIATLFIIGIVLCGFGCEDTSGHIYTDGAIEKGGDEEPIVLVNNPNATNPTYAELIEFIARDTINAKFYIERGARPYVCSDFAEDVHNTAEAAGIRAAWVGIDFESGDQGHACNVFETTDKGLIYVDCLGRLHPTLSSDSRVLNWRIISPSEQVYQESVPTSVNLLDWDKIAYVQIGKEYGVISIANVKSLSYSFYEEYKQKRQKCERLLRNYREDVKAYNREIAGKVYYEGSPELARIKAWEARLEEETQALVRLADELGGHYFEPLSIVRDIHIHW